MCHSTATEQPAEFHVFPPDEFVTIPRNGRAVRGLTPIVSKPRGDEGVKVPVAVPFRRDVTSFAQHLQAAMNRGESKPKEPSPFADALRAFEQSLDSARLTAATVQSEGASGWVAALGLTLPCTIEDVKRAFRRLAFQTHPDRPGGSHDAFLEAQALLHRALADLEVGRAELPTSTPHFHRWERRRPVAATRLQAFA